MGMLPGGYRPSGGSGRVLGVLACNPLRFSYARIQGPAFATDLAPAPNAPLRPFPLPALQISLADRNLEAAELRREITHGWAASEPALLQVGKAGAKTQDLHGEDCEYDGRK